MPSAEAGGVLLGAGGVPLGTADTAQGDEQRAWATLAPSSHLSYQGGEPTSNL